ncbi:MAG: hypothetical protein P8Z80_01050 [Pseudolabrys sp.]
METLTRLNHEHAVTMVAVTHEADIAAYADRVLTMRDGQLISDKRNPKPTKSPLPAPAATDAAAAVHPGTSQTPARNAF